MQGNGSNRGLWPFSGVQPLNGPSVEDLHVVVSVVPPPRAHLVPLGHLAEGSNTPVSKAVIVKLEPTKFPDHKYDKSLTV